MDDELEADPSTRPAQVVRFGVPVDVKGGIAPSTDADRAVLTGPRLVVRLLTLHSTTPSSRPGS